MKTLMFAAALFAFVLTAAGPNASHAATTCEDLLANNTYQCFIKFENGAVFPSCFTFTNPGVQSSEFDLSLNGGQVLSCACNTTGSFNNPKFDASTSFQCVTNTNPEESFNFVISGKAVGTNIKKGQIVDSGGNSYFIDCKLDPSCSN